MNEVTLRKWHRRIGFVLGPMMVVQAVTGLTLSIPSLYDAQERVHSALAGRRMPSLSFLWKFLLVDGHTGGGIFGIWYTLLIGGGLAFIALSGILIFLVIRQRMKQKAATKALSDTTRDNATGSYDLSDKDLLSDRRHVLALNWRAYTMLVVGLVLVLFVATYTNFLAYKIANRDTAISITVSEIILQTMQAHLEQEEILGGSRLDGMERVRTRLGKVDTYTIALANGGVTDLGVLPPPDDPAVSEKYKSLRQVFLQFKNISEVRGVVSSRAVQTVDIVKAYDRIFNEFLVQAEDINKSTHHAYLENIYAFRSKFALFLSLNVLLLLLAAIAIYRLEKDRASGSRRKVSKIGHIEKRGQ